MFEFTQFKVIATVAALGVVMIPEAPYARVNSLTGGLAVSFDYDDRNYDSNTPLSESFFDNQREDDYKRFVLTPLAAFKSSSERDNFELRAEPGIKYDLDDYETDWDNNIYGAVDRFITKSWQLRLSDQFLRSDYYTADNTFSSQPTAPDPAVSQPVDPQLSTDPGRRRYWRNTLNFFSDSFYREDSLFQLGFSYTALRNDDDGIQAGGYEDYDRYVISLVDEHRFNPVWKSSLDFSYVKGDYDSISPLVADAVIGQLVPGVAVSPANDQLSNDLEEYRLLLGAENNSIDHNPLFLTYNYIGTQYDEPLRNDGDIHQVRFTWEREFSAHLKTKLGAGPSYEKTENRDANWGGNGIAELNYQVEHGFINFLLDKRYEVENFSGNDERGPVDSWDTRVLFGYQLQKDWALSGSLAYLYQDRYAPIVAIERASVTGDPLLVIANADLNDLAEYHRDRYIAGIGLSYTFLEFYMAKIGYTYTNEDYDAIRDDYDDHRILLTLSWQKELFRW